jgi:hypothetical protein
MGIPRWRPGCVTDPMIPTTYQRGGIDSDPLVRLLAYRAWRDRDRRWFTDRGVRSGDLVAATRRDLDTAAVALAWQGEPVLGRAVADARPGELVQVARDATAAPAPRGAAAERFRVTDRLRAEPTGP